MKTRSIYPILGATFVLLFLGYLGASEEPVLAGATTVDHPSYPPSPTVLPGLKSEMKYLQQMAQNVEVYLPTNELQTESQNSQDQVATSQAAPVRRPVKSLTPTKRPDPSQELFTPEESRLIKKLMGPEAKD